MRLLVLVALLLLVFGAYSLVNSARDLAVDVGAMSSEHAATAGVPRVVNADAVKVTQGVAGFRVVCENDSGCAGTMTIALENDAGGDGSAPYSLEANVNRWVGVPLPPDTDAKHGTITWREASGATASSEFTLQRH